MSLYHNHMHIHQSSNALRCRTLAAAGLALLSLNATAQTNTASATSQTASTNSTASAATLSQSGSATEDWLKKSKNPVSWLKLNGDLRLRDEYMINAPTLDDRAAGSERNYNRFRARLGATFTFVDNLDINSRVIAEPRLWYRGRTPQKGSTDDSGWDWTEGIIDTLNVNYTNAFNLPMAITAGRQDIRLGDPTAPWLVADGTPLDGSRTAFFDAVRVNYKVEEIDTTVDAVAIDQHAMNDYWLPPINHLEKTLSEQDERGAILYVSNKTLPKTQVDGFFIYKHDRRVMSSGNDSDLYTLGGRVAGEFAEHYKYNTEGAWQLGNKNSADVNAFSVNSSISYLFKDHLNNTARFSYEYASGDNPNSATYTEFDPLWGRYPRWSDLYIYSMSPSTEGRPSQIANLHRIGPGWSLTPCKKTEVVSNAYLLLADNNTYANKAGLFTQHGGIRGEMLQVLLKYKFNSHISSHLLGEFLWPGDYYANRDTMQFLRAEMMLTW